MREAYILLFSAMTIMLGVCAVLAAFSRKRNGKSVAFVLVAFMVPVIGNIFIVSAVSRNLSTIGEYIYFLGMDLTVLGLLTFAIDYCEYDKSKGRLRYIAYALLAADAVQYAINPITGHAFTTEEITVGKMPYYRLVPLWGQVYHRVIDYTVILVVLILFIIKIKNSPKVYAEKYYPILTIIILGCLGQTFFIFSKTPIDRSMIGFGLLGICIYYFALCYRSRRLLDRMLANLASDTSTAIYFFDLNDRCLWANTPGREFLGIDEEDFSSVRDLLGKKFSDMEREDDEWKSQSLIISGGEVKYYSLERHSMMENGRKTGSFLSIRENTADQMALQNEIYTSTHDTLTGLFKRDHLFRLVRERLLRKRKEQYCAIFINIKNFKIVNDVFSNSFGNTVLKAVAKWIDDRTGPDCIYGRLHADTFGCLVPVDEFRSKLEMLTKELENFVVKDEKHEYKVILQLGAYEILPGEVDEIPVSVMFDRAHMALSSIKDEYRTHVAVYDDDMRENVLWDQQIANELKDALEDGQLCPYLQPIVDANGNAIGAEALVRWIHPQYGFLAPFKFIPMLEKSGMIVDVDRFMWKSACELLAKWKKEGYEQFISINISPKDFYFMDVVEELNNLVKEYGVEAEKLRVEITESVMITDVESRMKILDDLRKSGFIIEMDDFGSGYSSLNLLKDMPVDVLKIDMKFLEGNDEETKAKTILKNIINLTKDLDIVSLTEGVETERQYSALSIMGCRLFQGYHFSKPLPVAEFEEKWLKKGTEK